uniref:TRPM SLOG domain-containing protein n=1 Tax=Astyanax mexicanus TaxID=7994 RepID=A0A8B9H6B8_ASTMX
WKSYNNQMTPIWWNGFFSCIFSVIYKGVSMYVGDAVKVYGTHERRKRNIIGITPWGLIENHSDLIGRDVLRHYQTLGNPLSKRSSLNGLHSHFLLVDDGTLGKSGGQLDLRKKLERHVHRQRIHPRLAQRVPVVCVVVEGGPPVLATVLEYVSRTPPVPVIVFEGTGRAADLLALIHKQTAVDRWASAAASLKNFKGKGPYHTLCLRCVAMLVAIYTPLTVYFHALCPAHVSYLTNVH